MTPWPGGGVGKTDEMRALAAEWRRLAELERDPEKRRLRLEAVAYLEKVIARMEARAANGGT